MSLNGLDAPAIQEAHQQTLVEAGGWFLLKYTSRDSVELLSRGKGGVHEARVAISKYEEPSPLYGLLIYRRRKVLIKYIPEGTSRLLQARTAVHFQDVLERYSPCETLLEITTADGLNDTSLASSFPLHTASPSASSNRLHEISEDGEDSGAIPRRPANQTFSSSGSIFGTQRYKMEKRVDQLMGPDRLDRPRMPTPSIQVTNDSMSTLSSPLSSPLSSHHKTSISQFLVRDESGQRSITSIGSPQSLASMTDYAGSDISDKSAEPVPSFQEQPKAQTQTVPLQDTEPSPDAEPSQPSFSERPSQVPSYTAERLNSGLSERSVERPSIQERPSMSESRKYEDDPYDFWRFEPKPKVKLGPRPVAPGDKTKRSTVASVSAVPATYRPTTKKQEPSQPQSHGSMSFHASATPVLPRPPPIPNMPEYNPRPVSRGSIKSLPSHKSTAMTPDKVRLMKAVELRKKQLRKSNPQQTFVPPKDEVPALPKAASPLQPVPQKEPEKFPELEAQIDDEQRVPSKKPDSGIEMGYERLEKHAEEDSAEVPRGEEKEAAVDPATLAQLQSSPTFSRQSLRLDTSRPSSQQTPALPEHPAEPTMSLDMLDNSPRPAFSHLRELSSTDSPTLGRPNEDVSFTTHPQRAMSRVPTIVMADGSRPLSSDGQDTQPVVSDTVPNDSEVESAGDDTTCSNLLDQFPPSPRRDHSKLAKRRRGIVEPLHIEPDGDFTSDDEFLEELRSATFQEAKPMTVRSPMAPSFYRTQSTQSVVSERSVTSVKSINIRRSSSNLLEQFTESPDRMSPDVHGTSPFYAQSVSTLPLERSDSSQVLKRNVSTGISKRIQDLAEVRGRDAGSSSTSRPLTPETMTHNTWRERKSAVRSPPRSRTSSFKSIARQSSRMSGYASGNITPGASGFQQPEPVWTVQHDPVSNRDSVSVTARIVRTKTGGGVDDSAQSDGTLQQSQLAVNHKRASASAPTSRYDNALPPLNTNHNPAPQGSESAPSVTAHSPTMTRGSTDYRTLHSSNNRKSFGRYRQQAMSPMTPSPDDFPPPPTDTTTSRASIASSNDEHAAPKEGTRTSRFFKRMSNLGGGGGSGHKRKGSGQASAGAASTHDGSYFAQRQQSVANTDQSDMPPAVVVGELNSQFPDSLLWKRRLVEIDDAGYLVFAISRAMDMQKKVAAKKYHLSEFKMPYAPDLDRQELPHSVMLDFVDGATLQAACEDAMTHRQVLHVLGNYWKAWAGSRSAPSAGAGHCGVIVASLPTFEQAYGHTNTANATKGSWLSRVSHRASHIPNRPLNQSAGGSRETLPLRTPGSGSAGFFGGNSRGGSTEQLPVLQKTSSYPACPTSPVSPTETEFAGATPIDASFGDRVDIAPEPPLSLALRPLLGDSGALPSQRSRSGTATQVAEPAKKKSKMDKYAHQAGDQPYDSDGGEADDEFEHTLYQTSPTQPTHYDDRESDHPSESEEEHESVDGGEDTPTTQGWGTGGDGRSPTGLITDWSEEQVADYIAALSPALKQYGQAFVDEGINGDALVALSHDDLRELGVSSVGHRLTILKAVYDQKVRSGVKIEEDDYVPLSAEGEKGDLNATQDDIARVIESIRLRDQRIIAAEAELKVMKQDLDRIADENRKLREETLPIMRLVKDQRTPLPDPSGGTIPSPRDFEPPKQQNENLAPVKESKGSSLSRKFSTKKLFLGSAPKQPSPTHPPQSHTPQPREVRDDPGGTHLEASAAAMAASSHLTASMTSQTSPNSAGLGGQQLSPTSPAYSTHAPSSGGSYHQPGSAAARSFPRDGGNSARHAYAPQHQDETGTGYSTNSQWSNASTIVAERDTRESPASARMPSDRPSRRQAPTPSPREDEVPQSAPLPRDRDRDRDRYDIYSYYDTIIKICYKYAAEAGLTDALSGDRDNPQVEIFKSFRVSIEDPCRVVLPVALKRYNITDDWRQYALYIVHGDQERCLGLEEKPLMLFKQLDKEGRKPMFMLRRHASPQEGWSGTTAHHGGGAAPEKAR
ncbi:hypothetical protein LTR36_002081 [Oleoguttula mirabilis]|uniref:Uncharacterized protein n=1 Tax=Oleoguttula mirabilis TaxID=1507867 RepID=A0AAV9JMC2_9PEZI|nr:hypothetical protein LTR36_002081 [Oleoguttula mirabilis]